MVRLKKRIFVTGGCRSGKSRFALDWANRHFSRKLFVATCEVLDEEMAMRVGEHKKARGPEWQTLEEPVEIVDKMEKYANEVEVILIDCVTLWLTNLLIRWGDDERVMDEVSRFTDWARKSSTCSIIVSNEIGMGIVPMDPLSRRFRDLAGTANQKLAAMADQVVLMVSGLPVFLKGGG